MTLWTAQLRRDDVLTLLGAGSPAGLAPVRPTRTPIMDVREPPRGCVAFLWDGNLEPRLNRPPAVLVPASEASDFLAWASTYLEAVRPFTAHSRVLDLSEVRAFAEAQAEPTLGALESALAGLIIAEALAASGAQGSLAELSIMGCESTYLYAFARALAYGTPPQASKSLFAGWRNARLLTRQPTRDLPEDTVANIQATLIDIMYGGPTVANPIVRAASEILETGEITQGTWSVLTEGSRDLADARSEMRGTREQRVRLTEQLLTRASNDSPSRQFALGYILSLFDNGATINTHLIPRTPRWATMLLWYGLASGLHPGTSIQDVGGGLGRRVIRDLLDREAPFAPPRCDIGVRELAILLGGPKPVDDFRSGSLATLWVELAPRVSTVVRWSPRQATASAPPPYIAPSYSSPRQEEGQRGLFDSSNTGHLLNELGDTLDRARQLLHRLTAGAPDPDDHRKRPGARRK